MSVANGSTFFWNGWCRCDRRICQNDKTNRPKIAIHVFVLSSTSRKAGGSRINEFECDLHVVGINMRDTQFKGASSICERCASAKRRAGRGPLICSDGGALLPGVQTVLNTFCSNSPPRQAPFHRIGHRESLGAKPVKNKAGVSDGKASTDKKHHRLILTCPCLCDFEKCPRILQVTPPGDSGRYCRPVSASGRTFSRS